MNANSSVAPLLLASPDSPPDTARERYLASQRAVGALLKERNLIMNALIDLVNASGQYRFVEVSLLGEPNMKPAWDAAYLLCQQWVQARGNNAATPEPATEEPKGIVIPVVGSLK